MIIGVTNHYGIQQLNQICTTYVSIINLPTKIGQGCPLLCNTAIFYVERDNLNSLPVDVLTHHFLRCVFFPPATPAPSTELGHDPEIYGKGKPKYYTETSI